MVLQNYNLNPTASQTFLRQSNRKFKRSEPVRTHAQQGSNALECAPVCFERVRHIQPCSDAFERVPHSNAFACGQTRRRRNNVTGTALRRRVMPQRPHSIAAALHIKFRSNTSPASNQSATRKNLLRITVPAFLKRSILSFHHSNSSPFHLFVRSLAAGCGETCANVILRGLPPRRYHHPRLTLVRAQNSCLSYFHTR